MIAAAAVEAARMRTMLRAFGARVDGNGRSGQLNTLDRIDVDVQVADHGRSPAVGYRYAGAGGATTVPNGGTLQIVATVNPTNATNPILNYTVTPGTGTATIDALTGLLTGTGVGTVTVTVSATDASGVTCTLEIDVV